MTWGVGTFIMLFYNGVALGAIVVDYIRDGQTKFLLGWLLPHGVVEIPAILIAGQAGLILAFALVVVLTPAHAGWAPPAYAGFLALLLVVITLIPVGPLVLTMIPLEELLKRLLQVVL